MHDITEIPGPGQYLSPTVTDEEGLFSIKPKQAKNYRFVVVKDGFTRQEFEVTISPESQPVHIELLLSKADTTLEAHVFYNNQPYDADQMMFATIENKFVQQLKHEKDPQQSGVFLLKGLSEGVVDLMGAGMSPSQMRYSFSRGVQIVKGQTSKVILNLIDVAVYQVTLKPPADEKIQGAYTYEVPDYPDLSYYPTPPVMPNNMIVILSLAGHHKVRLNVPGYRPVEFFPDELAQTGQQSNMKMFTLELQKM